VDPTASLGLEVLSEELEESFPGLLRLFLVVGLTTIVRQWTVYDFPSYLPFLCYTPNTIGNNKIV